MGMVDLGSAPSRTEITMTQQPNRHTQILSRTGRWGLLAFVVAVVAGCTGVRAPSPPELDAGHARVGPALTEATQPVLPSLEEAAAAAFARARHQSGIADRGRIRVGTIQRVEGGFTYTPPRRSGETVWSARPPKVRYQLRPSDVATYVIHPRSGDRAVDRSHEAPTAEEKRIVDELDPAGRPLFVLTPTLKIIRYEGPQTERIVGIEDVLPELF
jgi:hypothetical protein